MSSHCSNSFFYPFICTCRLFHAHSHTHPTWIINEYEKKKMLRKYGTSTTTMTLLYYPHLSPSQVSMFVTYPIKSLYVHHYKKNLKVMAVFFVGVHKIPTIGILLWRIWIVTIISYGLTLTTTIVINCCGGLELAIIV